MTSNNNTSKEYANYSAAALVAKANHKVTVTNVTFESLNVRVPDTGNVALLCGGCGAGGSVELENVAIKNSTVIGGRSVAALVGATAGGSSSVVAVTVKGTLALENVNVYTTQGRSALLVTTNMEKAMNIADNATITITNSFCKMYEDERFEQVKVATSDAKYAETEHKIVDANGNDAADFTIFAVKTLGKTGLSKYAHKDNALVLQYVGSNTREAIMTVEELVNKY
jgi:phosphomevalonate kinase